MQPRTDATSDEDHSGKEHVCTEKKDKGGDNEIVGASPGDVTLQHALAYDRLQSLTKTRERIEHELADLRKDRSSKAIENDKLLEELVREERRPKRKQTEVKKSRQIEKRQKKVSFDDDADFDAVLDAASTGFVETVS